MVKADFDVTIYTTQAQADATRKVVEEGAGYDRIICSGGDGTLDEVMTGLMQKQLNIPIGYIPAGSTNDFANSLGIPKEMLGAAELAVGDRLFPCDIGDFNSDTFVYVAAFGLFTEVSYKTSQQLKNIFGHVAYIMEGVKQLHDIVSYKMQVEYDGHVFQDEFIYGMITNSVSVGGFKGMTGDDVKLDDGVFEVTLIRKPRNPIELNEILACLTNMIDDSDMIYSFKTDFVHITAKEAVAWTLDGEFGGAHEEVVIRNLKQRVNIIC
jgi:YegS/Rv2252/BmrU family lipid kinase